MTALRALLLIAMFAANAVPAATVDLFSPQGEVKGVRQVSARFSAPLAPFGDPRRVEPFRIDCPAKGVGRWVDGRNWVYDFDAALPAGVSCAFTTTPGLTTLAGDAVTPARFAFNTGGPAVMRALPYEGAAIDEHQIFILALDAPATDDSVAAHARCEVEGIGERIPVRVLKGEEKARILAERHRLGDSFYRLVFKGTPEQFLVRVRDPAAAPLPVAVLQCTRALPNDARTDLVWGKGIATTSGIGTSRDQRLAYRVRPAFNASFSCTRVNPQSGCVPVLPMHLSFGAPVERSVAEAIVLRAEGGGVVRARASDERSPFVTSVTFAPPFPERTRFRVELPAGLKDDAGRTLANRTGFPLPVATDEAPPLVKFSGRFGILEAQAGGVLPVTLRNVEPTVVGRVLAPGADGGAIPGRVTATQDDAAIIEWLKRLNEGGRPRLAAGSRRDHARREGEWSLFDAATPTRPLAVPKPGGAREFEVVGIPLGAPGFYVVELESPRLGAALHGEPKPYFVQTGALVTHSAAHFKWGRESSLVWVTTLDGAKPLANATVAVRDCNATLLWEGRTDADGLAAIRTELPGPGRTPACRGFPAGLFVSARAGNDVTFVLSAWNEGIQPWQFNLPVGGYDGHLSAHTVFDRTLLRAGETVSMKHFLRTRTSTGFATPSAGELPSRVIIEHQGSGQRFEQALEWTAGGTAVSAFEIPKDAKLGVYGVSFSRGRHDGPTSGQFRVEQFRVPTMKAVIKPPAEALVAPKQVPLDLLLTYLSGGGAGGAPVTLRTQLQPRTVTFPGYEAFQFAGGEIREGAVQTAAYDENAQDEEEPDATSERPPGPSGKPTRSLPLTLDATGAGRAVVDDLPEIRAPQDLVAEMQYQDANGETLVVAARTPLWPARINLGVRTEGWAASRSKLRFQVAAVDVAGRPVPDTPVTVELFRREHYSHRRRLVGGFYAYEDFTETKRIGEACRGTTNAQGLVLCEAKPGVAGEVLIHARAAGAAAATRSVYVVGSERWWFRLGASDRMDVLPEKRRYEPGETARFQVRMPFAEATALVTVEREGVLETRVQRLTGREPVIEVPLTAQHAPNVFVSVLALRGRVTPPPTPLADLGGAVWALPATLRLLAQREAEQDIRPRATVDLGKPAFRLGVAEIKVGWTGHELKVGVAPDRETYRVRDRASVRITVRRADGGPLPKDAELAFAAVDEGLLELAPNDSWQLLDAMMRPRGIEVFTSTAQMQVVGKRHFGKKAGAPGGGGGRQAGRELFDTLLLWRGRVALDEQGTALVDIPLNDSLTGFRLVAIASAGPALFGTGAATIRTTQDVMVHAGVPPLVREGDTFRALFTLRNTTDRMIALDVTPALATDTAAPAPPLDPLAVELSPGESRELGWTVAVPTGITSLAWDIAVRERNGPAADRIRVKQAVTAAHPVRVYQATLLQLDEPLRLAVAIPADALPGRGGVSLALRSRLADELTGVRDYMSRYAWTCLEQRASKAVALRDETRWAQVASALPSHLDRDGLAKYFVSDYLDGSDTLTAYLLAVAHAAGYEIPESTRERMIAGLAGFIEGRVVRHGRLPTADLALRKLAAIEALSRYGAARPQMLDPIAIDPALWPTSAVLDWLGILERVDKLPRRSERIAEARQILRARLNFQGTTMGFSTERGDALWWLMISGDQNAVRTLLALLDDPAWREDVPRLVRGALGRQVRGHWNTTPANAWGVLAMEKFSAKFEATQVGGATTATLAGATRRLDWTRTDPATFDFPWPTGTQPLKVAHAGSGKPWVTVASRAAIPLKAPLSSGYTIRRTVTAIEQKAPGTWTRGDVYRVTLDLEAQSDMTWVVVSDPIPAGATILGTGLGRDSQLLTRGERREGWVWPAYEERTFEAFRAYYEFVPGGKWKLEYTVRLNNEGSFDLPTTRVEAMYSPEMFGEVPNARITVAPR